MRPVSQFTTKELIDMIRANPSLIETIPNPSTEMMMAAIESDPFSIRYMPNAPDSIKEEAVRRNGMALEHIQNPSENIMLAAVEGNGNAIRFIPGDRRSEGLSTAAVSNDCLAIRHIEDPVPAVWEAAEKDPDFARKFQALPESHKNSFMEYRRMREALAGLNGPEGKKSLAGMDLRGMGLNGMDLERVDLTGANLEGANLSGSNLKGCIFDGAVLTGADLSRTNASGTSFRNARMDRVSLRDSNVSRSDLSGASIKNADLRSASFDESMLRKTELEGSVLNGCSMIDADIYEVHAVDAKMTGVVLDGANIRYSDFYRAKLKDADFENAHIYKTSLRGARLNRAIFSGSTLNEVIFDGVKMTKGQLENTELTRASFREADISGAMFSSSQIKDCRFENTKAYAADFNRTNFERNTIDNSDFTSSNWKWSRIADVSVTGSVFAKSVEDKSVSFEEIYAGKPHAKNAPEISPIIAVKEKRKSIDELVADAERMKRADALVMAAAQYTHRGFIQKDINGAVISVPINTGFEITSPNGKTERLEFRKDMNQEQTFAYLNGRMVDHDQAVEFMKRWEEQSGPEVADDIFSKIMEQTARADVLRTSLSVYGKLPDDVMKKLDAKGQVDRSGERIGRSGERSDAGREMNVKTPEKEIAAKAPEQKQEKKKHEGMEI